MLASRLARRRAAGLVDRGRFGRAVGEKIRILEELLRDGGDVAPGCEVFRRDAVGDAKPSIGRNARELPREKFPGEVVPFRLIHRPEQLPDPGAASRGLEEIE